MTLDPEATAEARRAKTSDLLRALARAAPERVSLGAIADALQDRSVGIIVLCLALPNGVPGPYMPGFSTILAAPILWLAVQLARGHRRPRLPGFLSRRSFGRLRFTAFVDRAVPLVLRVERWLRPRPSWLTTRAGLRCLGFALIVFSIALAMPLPLGNVPIATGISVLALGLIEEDSRALALGLVLGLLGCLWQVFLVTAGVAVWDRVIGYFW